MSNDDLKEQLITAGAEKLSDILCALYQNHKDIRKQLNIIFAGLDEDPKKITGLIKKEISSLKRSTRFVDYYESDALANQLDALRLRITYDLGEKSPKIAFETMLAFLDLHDNTLSRVDDSNGVVGDAFMTACADLGSLSESQTHLSIPEIVDMVFSKFMDNPYGIYDKLILHFKNSLTDEGFALLQAKFEQAFNEENGPRIKCGLEAIADCQNDVDAFIRACSFTEKPCSHDHLDIAKRLIDHWRGEEALEWLARMELCGNHPWQEEKHRLKIQALELDGQYQVAQSERLAWFEEKLNPEIYWQIVKNAQPDFQEFFRVSAIKKAFDFQEPHTALYCLIQIQEAEEAAKFIRLKHDQLHGRQYYTLRPIADSLRDIDPIAATLLYRKLIQPVLEEAKSKYYNYAAKDLFTCGMLSSQITSWENLKSHIDYFNSLAEQHKRKVGFWSQYQAVLEKQTAKNSGKAQKNLS